MSESRVKYNRRVHELACELDIELQFSMHVKPYALTKSVACSTWLTLLAIKNLKVQDALRRHETYGKLKTS